MNKSKITLKLNRNNKIDLSKITTPKSSSITEIEDEEVKQKEIKFQKAPTTPLERVMLDFQEIYNKLHSKFPNIINMNNPVIFAISIHKELKKEAEIPKQFIKKWLKWYIRKSKYHNNYQQGAVRLNLTEEECGTVSEEEANYAASKINNWFKKKEAKQEILQ